MSNVYSSTYMNSTQAMVKAAAGAMTVFSFRFPSATNHNGLRLLFGLTLGLILPLILFAYVSFSAAGFVSAVGGCVVRDGCEM
jgi:hypothetical protein